MKKILFILMFVFSGAAARAETALPVEISAARSLEWNRAEKTYTARENVVVLQGTTQIRSDIVTARYEEQNGAPDITELEASGSVVILSPPYTAHGDKGVYNVKTGIATLTGNDLKIITDAETMTARDKIEFSTAKNRLTATGNAMVVRGLDTVRADILNAFFSKSRDGKLAADKITAHGHVTIKTAKETVTGDEGVYNIPAQTAVLTGKVRIRQGENWLEGSRADVDMTTGISQLLGNGGGGNKGRVKGVFYPKPKNEGSGN